MASAYENPNVSVRLSCVKSLCKCLVIDKHATVAPPKVIMTCISSIFIPIVKDLLESLKSMSFRCPALEKGIDEMPFEVGVVDRAVAITTATIEDANADQDADEVIRKEEQTPAHTASENEANESKNNESDKSTSEYLKVVEDAFVALCQLFTLQSKRILHYPSFDKLWFQLLDVLGIILKDVTYPFPNLDDKLEGSVSNKDGVEHNSKSLCPHSTKISNMQNVANDQLKNILMITVVSGIFHKKPVLWELTCEYIHAHYKYCPNITDELFVNGNLANPSESFIATPFKR